MVFVAVGVVALIAQIWMAKYGGIGEVPMPPAMRLLLPVAAAISAFRFKRNERIAMLLVAVLLFRFLDKDFLPNASAISALTIVTCVLLVMVGSRSTRQSSLVATRWLLFASIVAVVAFGLWLLAFA